MQVAHQQRRPARCSRASAFPRATGCRQARSLLQSQSPPRMQSGEGVAKAPQQPRAPQNLPRQLQHQLVQLTHQQHRRQSPQVSCAKHALRPGSLQVNASYCKGQSSGSGLLQYAACERLPQAQIAHATCNKQPAMLRCASHESLLLQVGQQQRALRLSRRRLESRIRPSGLGHSGKSCASLSSCERRIQPA